MRKAGIDIGTTSISAVVLNEDGSVEEIISVPSGSTIISSRRYEDLQDPEKILAEVFEILHVIHERWPDLSGICLTGQMHGIVYYDETGMAVSPLYTWQDGSGNELSSETGKRFVDELKEQYGVPAASGYGLVTYLFHIAHCRVPAKAEGIACIADYAAMRLCGNTRAVTHLSNAASLGFFDVQSRRFLDLDGVNHAFLPEVREAVMPVGNWMNIPVYLPIGDNQASFLGAVQPPYESAVLLNFGTGSQISVCTETPGTAEGLETRPLNDNLYLLCGSALCGGSAYALLNRFFTEFALELGIRDKDIYQVMESMRKKAEADAGLYVDTRFLGTREHPEETGAILHVTPQNFTPGNLVKAFLEGMCDELYQYAERACADLSGKQVYLSGNAARKNPALRQAAAERFGCQVRMGECEEEAALGAIRASEMEE